MADSAHTRSASVAHGHNPAPTQSGTFGAVSWLTQFRTVGGAFALTAGGLHLWIVPGDRSDDELSRARRMVSHLTPDQRSALKDHLGAQVGESPAAPSSSSEPPRTPEIAGAAGEHEERTNHMNMMTRIQAREAGAQVDEPSAGAGRDLASARPIEDVVSELEAMHEGHALAFLAACSASGIDVALWSQPGREERLILGSPLDGQERTRSARMDALIAHLKGDDGRRDAVIVALKLKGGWHA